jgi:acetolactate synthase-1/2/3 large subunit
MFTSVTRDQVRVTAASNAVPLALSALETATNPAAPGPVLLVLPMDCATESVEFEPLAVLHRTTPLPATDCARPAADSLQLTAQALANARRPLLVLGGACLRFPERVLALVNTLRVPFVTTPRAKGVVSEEHPLSLRNGGMAASGWARRYTADGVDVSLVLGSDLDDVSIGLTPYVTEGGKLIHVDTDPRVFGRNLPLFLGIRADLDIFAEELTQLVSRTELLNTRAEALCKDVKRHSPYDAPDFATDARQPIAPHRALHDLTQALGDARFITDIGEHMLFCLHYLLVRKPGDFVIQLGLGSMGSGIAGATGLALADRCRPVVCICGDGGMHMAGMEVLISKQLGLPIVYAVFNDSRYNMVHHGMKQVFGVADDYGTPEVDFAHWAGSLGVPAMIIRRPGEVNEAMLRGLRKQGGPVLLDIRIDREIRVAGAGRVEALQRMSMFDAGAPSQ